MPRLPASSGALKVRGIPQSQILRSQVQEDLFHADSAVPNPQAVKGICLAAPTRRDGRVRLHDERRVTGELIAAGRHCSVPIGISLKFAPIDPRYLSREVLTPRA